MHVYNRYETVLHFIKMIYFETRERDFLNLETIKSVAFEKNAIV